MKMIAVIDEKFNKQIAVEIYMALRMKLVKRCGCNYDMRLYRAKEDIHSRRMSEIQSDLWLLLSECYVDDFDSLCNEDKPIRQRPSFCGAARILAVHPQTKK